MCRNTKYILQKPTPKIKQPAIQLAISQLFQKLKRRSTNKQAMFVSASQLAFPAKKLRSQK
jgi:hypothetical protein